MPNLRVLHDPFIPSNPITSGRLTYDQVWLPATTRKGAARPGPYCKLSTRRAPLPPPPPSVRPDSPPPQAARREPGGRAAGAGRRDRELVCALRPGGTRAEPPPRLVSGYGRATLVSRTPELRRRPRSPIQSVPLSTGARGAHCAPGRVPTLQGNLKRKKEKRKTKPTSPGEGSPSAQAAYLAGTRARRTRDRGSPRRGPRSGGWRRHCPYSSRTVRKAPYDARDSLPGLSEGKRGPPSS